MWYSPTAPMFYSSEFPHTVLFERVYPLELLTELNEYIIL